MMPHVQTILEDRHREKHTLEHMMNGLLGDRRHCPRFGLLSLPSAGQHCQQARRLHARVVAIRDPGKTERGR